MSTGVLMWWLLLCSVAFLNAVAWFLSAAALKRQGAESSELWLARRHQLLLSGGYVLGCGFRSVLPVFDIPRLGLVDTWLSSAIIGRSVATIAELCFAAQWALMMRETARATGSDITHVVSKIVLPLIAMAEAFSWYSVLSTSNLGHVFEETLWGLCAAMVVTCMVLIRPRCTPVRHSVRAAWGVAGFSYVLYMFLVDVPMYWSRWLADEAHGRQYLGILQGIVDASTRRIVTGDWAHWKSEVVWMSLYFSVGVWVSLSLIHAPVPRAQLYTRRLVPLPTSNARG